jgi:thiamine biosynthesis lipoprotein
MSIVRRARPVLGTLVEIRVEGLEEFAALHAIEEAFAEIALIHRLMSFHECDSDLARVHRANVGMAVDVDARTHEVLACALHIAEASQGSFDPTVAAEQVASGRLPRPRSPFRPDPRATWRDIELQDDQVRLRRPLWMDLGGIAKGFAVDRAVAILQRAGARQVCVNAGGDLRIAGPRCEHVHLRRGGKAQDPTDGIELSNAAVATSAGLPTRVRIQGRWCAAHVHGRSRRPVGTVSSATVVAPRCMLADALTKVVLAQGQASRRVLERFAAQACVHDPWRGWRRIGAAA